MNNEALRAAGVYYTEEILDFLDFPSQNPRWDLILGLWPRSAMDSLADLEFYRSLINCLEEQGIVSREPLRGYMAVVSQGKCYNPSFDGRTLYIFDEPSVDRVQKFIGALDPKGIKRLISIDSTCIET